MHLKLSILLLLLLKTNMGYTQIATKVVDYYSFNESYTLKVGDTIHLGLPSFNGKYKHVHVSNNTTISNLDYLIVKHLVLFDNQTSIEIGVKGNIRGKKCTLDFIEAIESGELILGDDVDTLLIIKSKFPFISHDTLFIDNAVFYVVGDSIELRSGSLPNGDFKFLTFSRGYWQDNMENKSIINNLEGRLRGQKFSIKSFYRRGSIESRFAYFIILNGVGLPRFEYYDCDIMNALQAGEIIHENYRTSTSINKSPQKLGKADELRKLSELHKDGIISDEEYNTSKEKLLNSY